MKSLLAAICVLAGATVVLAETPSETAKPTAPAKPATMVNKSKVKPAEKAKPVEPTIPGTVVTRKDGTYLGLEVVGGNFKLSFYDEKKKPMVPSVTRATARWPDTKKSGDSRCVLNPSGNALVGNQAVRPPFVFNVYMTLLEGEGEDAKAVETLVIPFRG